MIRKLTVDEKEKVKGGQIWPGPFDWCLIFCWKYCGDKEGMDNIMDDTNDEYRGDT